MTRRQLLITTLRDYHGSRSHDTSAKHYDSSRGATATSTAILCWFQRGAWQHCRQPSPFLQLRHRLATMPTVLSSTQQSRPKKVKRVPRENGASHLRCVMGCTKQVSRSIAPLFAPWQADPCAQAPNALSCFVKIVATLRGVEVSSVPHTDARFARPGRRPAPAVCYDCIRTSICDECGHCVCGNKACRKLARRRTTVFALAASAIRLYASAATRLRSHLHRGASARAPPVAMTDVVGLEKGPACSSTPTSMSLAPFSPTKVCDRGGKPRADDATRAGRRRPFGVQAAWRPPSWLRSKCSTTATVSTASHAQGLIRAGYRGSSSQETLRTHMGCCVRSPLPASLPSTT